MSNPTYAIKYGGVCGECDRDIVHTLPGTARYDGVERAWVRCAECGTLTKVERGTDPTQVRSRRESTVERTAHVFETEVGV